MIKRLALLCCILLLPIIAAAAAPPQANVHYGEWWIGGQGGVVFNANRNVDATFGNLQSSSGSLRTDPGAMAGAIVGYNFCMPYKAVWERYFGLALDFQWNALNSPEQHRIPSVSGNQYALSFLGRVQYPFGGNDKFTAGRFVPFLMAGPAIVWTESNFSNFNSSGKTATNVGVVTEIGFEFFMWPHVSIGPSFRYRHVFGPNFSVQNVDLKQNLDQFMILGRLAYHF
jgi:opacity protein-like surface antigen